MGSEIKMSEEILIQKKKKKTDYVLLRKLEDAYDEAEDDLKNKEEILIKSVHREYLKAENKGDFFQELEKSHTWYVDRFHKYELPLQFVSKSDTKREFHQKRKLDSIMDDLEEMEGEIPILEIDESLKEGTEYEDPVKKKREWIEKTRQELMSEEPKTIIQDSNFGKYQETKSMLQKITSISKHDFTVSDKYKTILIHQLNKAISHLNKLKEDLE